MSQSHVVLEGSERPQRDDAERVGDVDPSSPIELTLSIRAAKPLPEPGETTLSHEQLEQEYGATEADLEAVRSSMQAHGLTVLDASALTRSMIVEGTAEQIERTFRPGLALYRTASQGEYRGRDGAIEIPAEVADQIVGVYGLDERRVARRRTAAAPVLQGLGPADFEKRYAFPAGDGHGQRVAIAEFGGGYFPDDVKQYCRDYNRPEPTVKTVAVGLKPLTPQQIRALPPAQRQEAMEESGEVMLDIEVVAGLAPGAEIDVYFANFTQKGWVDLLDAVIASKPAPASLSVSWGLAEDAPGGFSPVALTAIDRRLQAAALLGVTVCVASGDDGSGDQVDDGRAHIDFPSSSPNVLAVGGTMVAGGGEVVWWQAPGKRGNGGGATGGGVSVEFKRPSWQTVHIASLNKGSIDGRVIPDVAALAGPPFYHMVLDGRDTFNGGTSASAPLWAALLARMAQASGKPPAFITPKLYAPAVAATFHAITSGDNTSTPPGAGYHAKKGFNAASGWGIPDGTRLMGAI
jgi:kumamolisin